MDEKQKYRVYATGTHCAAIDVYASSPEEAQAIAGQIDGTHFDFVIVYGGPVQIEDAELASDAKVRHDGGISEVETDFLTADDTKKPKDPVH